jgi:hypothetical protein
MEGLFEEPHNTHIMDLLFSLAHWHGLAKLRMHSDTTLSLLDAWTHTLGTDVRKFESKTCRHFGTVELDKEYAARQRRKVKKKMEKASKAKAPNQTASLQGTPAGESSQQPVTLTIRIPPLAKSSAGKGTAKGKRKKAASVSDSAQSKKAKTQGSAGSKSRSAPVGERFNTSSLSLFVRLIFGSEALSSADASLQGTGRTFHNRMHAQGRFLKGSYQSPFPLARTHTTHSETSLPAYRCMEPQTPIRRRS